VVTTVKSQLKPSHNSTSLGISAIIGSGMIAFSLIPSMCAFSSEIPLFLKRRPLFRDEFFYVFALVVLTLVCPLLFLSLSLSPSLLWRSYVVCGLHHIQTLHDGKITLIESIFLMIIYLGFLTVVVSGKIVHHNTVYIYISTHMDIGSFVRRTYRHKIRGISFHREESFVHKARRQILEHRSSNKINVGICFVVIDQKELYCIVFGLGYGTRIEYQFTPTRCSYSISPH